MGLGLDLPVVEWFDESGREMVHRYPPGGSGDIPWGTQVVCRESQSAVFFRDGKALDVLTAGRHTLSTMNLPLLTRVLSAPFDGKSPFRAEIVFVNRKVFTDLKWGTKEPVPFKDTEVGMVRLRAFGIFSVRVNDPNLFVNNLVGTRGVYTTDALEAFYRSILTARLNDVLGENVKSVFGLAQQYDEVAGAVKARTKTDFAQYGTELVDLMVEAITPPEEVQKMIDTKSSMGVLGSMDQYLKYKTAGAIGDAAQGSAGGEGGAMGTGVGLGMGAGVGAGMGAMMGQAMREAMQQPPQTGATLAGPAAGQGLVCGKCGKVMGMGSKFCDNCGNAFGAAGSCVKCRASLSPGAKFCPSCGSPQTA